MNIYKKHICHLISIILFFKILGCEFFTNNPDKYFAESKSVLLDIKNLVLDKEKISHIYRRDFIGTFYKVLKMQKIEYKIENYETELQTSLEIEKNFKDEPSEIRKLIFNDNAKSVFNLENNYISLDSALNYFRLSKEEVVSVFEKMKELKVISIIRFNEDPSSLAFNIDDRYYLIYTNNITNLVLERKKCPEKLYDNWYYYDGVL